MSLEEYKDIMDKFSKNGDMVFLEGATEQQIDEFEKNNNVLLPKAYKEWLLFSDGGELFIPAGVQMYGVAHKPLINVNAEERPDDTYIVLGSLSFGDPIIYKKGEEKIYIYNHEEGTIAEDETYSDFVAFINDLPSILGIEG